MVNKLKFFVLQGMLLATLFALYVQGWLQGFITSDARWFILGVLFVGGYGLLKVYLEKWQDSAWVSQILVRIGVAGLQLAIAVALAVIGSLLMSSSMIEPLKMFLTAIGQGMLVSVTAVLSSIWIDTNAYLLGGRNED